MPIDPADHLELLNLYVAYSFAFDTGDQEASAGSAPRTGASPSKTARWPTGPRSWCRSPRRCTPRAGIKHLVGNIARRHSCRRRGQAYIVAVGDGDDGGLKVITMGTYTDTFTKTAAGWRFQARTFSAWASMHSPGAMLVLPLGYTEVCVQSGDIRRHFDTRTPGSSDPHEVGAPQGVGAEPHLCRLDAGDGQQGVDEVEAHARK